MNRLLAGILVILGILLLANVALPILEYEVVTKQKFTKQKFLSPLGSQTRTPGSSTNKSFINPSNWFTGDTPQGAGQESGVKYYTLSIPKLGIDRATVEIGGEDLSKSLIHYKGTALPGKTGNAVIFGHSVLPQFFNPKNYLAIFSTLPRLEEGDKVIIEYDGVTYTYQISEMFEVPPTATEVLHQYHDGSHITLITCVPPGTYLRRLVVRANLVPLGI